jgi:Family of unknown function (DUF6448)
MRTNLVLSGTLAAFLLAVFLLPSLAPAHCDTLEGPVVMAAKKALEKGDVTPVLKWVKKENEAEIRALFKKTLAVRNKGPEARELADMHFFETLVRLHRAGEGAAYTGLKAGGVEPIIAAADEALEKGSADHLVQHVTDAVSRGIRQRYAKTLENKKLADESLAAGREFVESYVEFTHYVERIHLDTAGQAGHGGEHAEHEHK